VYCILRVFMKFRIGFVYNYAANKCDYDDDDDFRDGVNGMTV